MYSGWMSWVRSGRVGESKWRVSLALVVCLTACGGNGGVEPTPEGAGGASGQGGGASETSGAGQAGSAPSTTCPDTPPAAGSACNHTGGDCSYSADPCNPLEFECFKSVWLPMLQPKPSCGAPQPCGPHGLECHASNVCVIHPGTDPVFECLPNPCAAQSLRTSCDCAASLCEMNEVCGELVGSVVCTAQAGS